MASERLTQIDEAARISSAPRDDFATANAFRNDDLTRQNFALALVLANRYDDAQKVLRQIAAPVDGTTSRDPNVAECVYFIWAIATPDSSLSSRAANFLVFLDENRSSQELNGIDKDSFAALMQIVARELPRAELPCGSLGKIKSIMALLS